MQEKMINDFVKLIVKVARETFEVPEAYGPWPEYYGPKRQYFFAGDYESQRRREQARYDSLPFSTGGLPGY